MNVYYYASGMVALGVCVSIFIGKANRGASGCAVTFALALLALVLGVILAFPMLQLTISICRTLGSLCIATNDQTVWLLAYPLILFPVYWIVMLIAKGAPPTKQEVDSKPD